MASSAPFVSECEYFATDDEGPREAIQKAYNDYVTVNRLTLTKQRSEAFAGRISGSQLPRNAAVTLSNALVKEMKDRANMFGDPSADVACVQSEKIMELLSDLKNNLLKNKYVEGRVSYQNMKFIIHLWGYVEDPICTFITYTYKDNGGTIENTGYRAMNYNRLTTKAERQDLTPLEFTIDFAKSNLFDAVTDIDTNPAGIIKSIISYDGRYNSGVPSAPSASSESSALFDPRIEDGRRSRQEPPQRSNAVNSDRQKSKHDSNQIATLASTSIMGSLMTFRKARDGINPDRMQSVDELRNALKSLLQASKKLDTNLSYIAERFDTMRTDWNP
jgi:hypothetical protein